MSGSVVQCCLAHGGAKGLLNGSATSALGRFQPVAGHDDRQVSVYGGQHQARCRHRVSLRVGLFGHLKCIIDLDAEVSDGAVQFRMTE